MVKQRGSYTVVVKCTEFHPPIWILKGHFTQITEEKKHIFSPVVVSGLADWKLFLLKKWSLWKLSTVKVCGLSRVAWMLFSGGDRNPRVIAHSKKNKTKTKVSAWIDSSSWNIALDVNDPLQPTWPQSTSHVVVDDGVLTQVQKSWNLAWPEH